MKNETPGHALHAKSGALASKGTLGTFAGVFTPSVLTILGIILFLRLGYVVSNAGLGSTLLILPIVAMVMAAKDIELAAEPEEGEAGEKAQVSDALEAAQKKEMQAVKEAEEAVEAAEKARKEAEEIKKDTEAADPETIGKAEKTAEEAEKQADKLARKAAKAAAKAETAAREAEASGILPEETEKE